MQIPIYQLSEIRTMFTNVIVPYLFTDHCDTLTHECAHNRCCHGEWFPWFLLLLLEKQRGSVQCVVEYLLLSYLLRRSKHSSELKHNRKCVVTAIAINSVQKDGRPNFPNILLSEMSRRPDVLRR